MPHDCVDDAGSVLAGVGRSLGRSAASLSRQVGAARFTTREVMSDLPAFLAGRKVEKLVAPSVTSFAH